MKDLLSKKKWVIGLVVLVVALVGAGIAIPVMAQGGTGNAPVNSYGGLYLDSPTLARLAGVLGMTPADLEAQLQTGKTLTAIAQEKNIPIASLLDAIIAPYADQVASQLKYGYITQQQSQALLDAARQQAGSLLTQNMSGGQGNNNGGYGSGYCGGYGNGNFCPGYGWGMMGSGMMNGWGGYYNNSTLAPGSNPSTAPGVPASPWNGGRGWGMMGGGMMGRW